ncbi:MAG TPA: hypothetical protein VH186_18185 [Chloroflexia bacterium]|nr:hypothetical protein [Chloroflexia bacterium]
MYLEKEKAQLEKLLAGLNDLREQLSQCKERLLDLEMRHFSPEIDSSQTIDEISYNRQTLNLTHLKSSN